MTPIYEEKTGNQNWIVVINQRFLKNASVFIMCPQPGRQTKKSNQHRKHKKNKERIMQPESSKDPGGTSIQKLKEACELVTITKQRRHIFLNETKRTSKRGFTSSKVRLSGLRPEPFQLHWPHCLPGLRERVSA